jgi:hypothetical protein
MNATENTSAACVLAIDPGASDSRLSLSSPIRGGSRSRAFPKFVRCRRWFSLSQRMFAGHTASKDKKPARGLHNLILVSQNPFLFHYSR